MFLPAQKKRARLFAGREELKQITTQSEREGALTSTERAMIHTVVDFQNVTARDVMKPLSQVATVSSDATIDDVLKISRERGPDSLPVIDSTGDTVGLLNVLDILLDDQRQSLSRYFRRMVTVQESEPAARAVQRLRAARLGLAAVVDQKRNLIGVVMSEDLIARLVRA